jgi:flagellin
MSVIFRTNTTALKVLSSLNKTNRSLSSSTGKLASGHRIQSAKDDAAGLAISESLHAQVRSIRQASRNASAAISVLQTAEGASGSVANILVRLRELTMQSASGQYTDDQRKGMNLEFREIRREVTRVSQVTFFNGQKLLTGQLATDPMVFQIGLNNTDNDKLAVAIPNMRFGNSGLKITGNIKSQTNARKMMDRIDAAIDKVSAVRADLGAKVNRLTTTLDNLASADENLTAAHSRIKDLDVGQEMGQMVSQQILAQAGSAMLAQANALPQIALGLIG